MSRGPKIADERRLNLRVSAEEMRMIKLGADLYAGGNMSRFIRHLTLSVMPKVYASMNREKGEVPLKVKATVTPEMPEASLQH